MPLIRCKTEGGKLIIAALDGANTVYLFRAEIVIIIIKVLIFRSRRKKRNIDPLRPRQHVFE